ncbi:unnamed protein product, partial [Ectocarpus fasciculatus]
MSEDRTHMHHLQHPNNVNKGLFARLRKKEEEDSTKAEAVLASFIKSKLAAQQRQRSHDEGGNNASSAGKDLAILPPKQQHDGNLRRETPTPPPYYVRQQKKKRDEQVVVVRRTTQRNTGAPREVVKKKESRHEPPPLYRDAITPNFETGPERARYPERGAATLNRPRPSFDTAASITTIDSFDTFAALAPAPTPRTRPPQHCPGVAKSSSRRARGANNNNNNNGSGHTRNDPAVVVHAKQPPITAGVGQGSAPAPPAPVVRSYPVHAEPSPTSSEPSPTPGSLTPPSTHLELLRSRNRGASSPVTGDSHWKQSSTLSGPAGAGRARSNPGGGREELDENCSLASILPGGNRFKQQERSETTRRRSDAAPGGKHFPGTSAPGLPPHPGSDLETSVQEQDPTPPKPGRGMAGDGERGDKSGGGGGGRGDGGTPQPLMIRVASNSYRSSPDMSPQGRRGNGNLPFSPLVVHRSPTSAFATSRNSYHAAARRTGGGGGGATAEMRVRISENSEKEKAENLPPPAAVAGAAGAAVAVEPASGVDTSPAFMVPGDDPGSSPSASPAVWVTRHIDCSDTCGLVLVMSDSSVGLLFNDGTKMILGPGGDTLEYMEPSSSPTHKPEFGAEGRACGGGDDAAAALGYPCRSACGGATSYNYTLDSFPFYLQRKVAAVRYFREHLLPEGGSFADSTGKGTGRTSPAVAEAAAAAAAAAEVGQDRQAPLAFIEKWQREGDS